MKQNFEVRLANLADVAAMHRLRSSVLENSISDPLKVTEASYLPYVAAASAWVAATEKCIIGFCAIDGSKAEIWALFVDQHHEGLGIGRALHRQMLTWAKHNGLTRLSLSTGLGTRAEGFYRRAGWTQTTVVVGSDVLFELALGDETP